MPEGSAEYDIDSLPERLGLVLTERAIELEGQILQVSKRDYTPEELIDLLVEHRVELESIVEALPPDKYQEAQLGLLIATANIKRDVFMWEDYVIDLEDALVMADQLGLGDIKSMIDAVITVYEQHLDK